jgi:hypothetical protein
MIYYCCILQMPVESGSLIIGIKPEHFVSRSPVYSFACYTFMTMTESIQLWHWISYIQSVFNLIRSYFLLRFSINADSNYEERPPMSRKSVIGQEVWHNSHSHTPTGYANIKIRTSSVD